MVRTDSENAIRERIQALSLDQLSYREIADKLANEEDYDRAVVVRIIHSLKHDRRAMTENSGPIAFAVFGAILILFGNSPSDPINTPLEVRTIKVLAVLVGFITFMPSLFVLLTKYYDRVPGVNTVLEPIFRKQRVAQPDIVELDNQFLRGDLGDSGYESRLVAVLGTQRGRSHFRFMRNYKHFGLD
jgi:hypothetical protein